jgi:hypothetical protein
MDGTLAAVDAPSSSRVAPRIGRFVVSPVRITAIAPNTGPTSIIRWWPSRSDSTPNTGDSTSSER